MTVEELYAQIGGDYAEALKRLPSEALVAKFVVKYLDDPSGPALIASWADGDEAAAFEAAHAAKGVCANLSLNQLSALASDICEALRPGNDGLRAQTDVDALVAQFASLHATAVESIAAFK